MPSSLLYLGNNSLRSLIQSELFLSKLEKRYGLPKHLTWHKTLGQAIEFLLNGYDETLAPIEKQRIEQKNYTRYVRMFEPSRLCTIETAVKVIALIQVIEHFEKAKASGTREVTVKFWQQRLKDYQLDKTLIAKYFSLYDKVKEEAPIDAELLDGTWMVYQTNDDVIQRTLLLIACQDDNHRYFYDVPTSTPSSCSVSTNAAFNTVYVSTNINEQIKLTLYGTLFKGCKDIDFNIISGMIQTNSTSGIPTTLVPCVAVRIDKSITELPTAHCALLSSLEKNKPLYDQEETILRYVQLLSDDRTRIPTLNRKEPLGKHINSYLMHKGRQAFNTHKSVLKNQPWFSFCRMPRPQNDISINRWSFEFHEFRQSITAVRKSSLPNASPPHKLRGEIKYYNHRFWVNFSSDNAHKIMFLRYDEEDTESGPHFLAMGSFTREDHSNDLGDMITEILLPYNKLPVAYHHKTSMSYEDFKEIKGLSVDLKLYLNHKDQNILSFEDPDSDKSKLWKQKRAIAFQGSYLVYVYNRYAEKHRRLIRYTLDIDQLAVASLRKTFRSEPEKTHLFKGLAEEFNDNLHIIFEHDKTTGAPEQPQKLLQEIQLMVDSTPAYEDLNLLTGVLSDTDYAQNPRSMACVLVKTEEQTIVDDKRQSLVKVAQQNGFQPQSFCPNDTDEYKRLEQLLSQKLSGWLEKRLGNSLNKELIKEHGFLPYYFNSLGGVFYSGKD